MDADQDRDPWDAEFDQSAVVALAEFSLGRTERRRIGASPSRLRSSIATPSLSGTALPDIPAKRRAFFLA